MAPTCKLLSALLVSSLVLCALGLSVSLAQQGSSPIYSNVSLEAGRRVYNGSCAGCHGLDGSGSDKAVNISGGAKVRQLSDSQLAAIISDGVPGTGMPAFRNLSETETRAVVGYVRSLQGKLKAHTLNGDPERGKRIFFGKGECASCHTISGQGGFLGPDLSSYGSNASAKGIRDEIVKPRRSPAHGYRSAVLVTSDGDRMEGLVRNEDNFSVQFQTKDGSFYFFEKSKLRSLELQENSFMPTNYGERLSAGELDDLSSYLITASPAASARKTQRKDEEEPE
jgi:cytochrome c oxidase cbb3-type subunit III